MYERGRLFRRCWGGGRPWFITSSSYLYSPTRGNAIVWSWEPIENFISLPGPWQRWVPLELDLKRPLALTQNDVEVVGIDSLSPNPDRLDFKRRLGWRAAATRSELYCPYGTPFPPLYPLWEIISDVVKLRNRDKYFHNSVSEQFQIT